MSQHVKVEQGGALGRGLEFTGAANNTGNIVGRPSNFNQIVWYDDFTGKAIDTTNDYTVAGVNSGACTITVPHCLTLTTGAADDDDVDFAMGIEFYGQYNACLEARFRIDDVDKCGMNIGFADATGYAADLIAMTGNGTAIITTAANFAGFCADVDFTTKNLYGVSVNAGSDGAIINSASTPTDAKWYTVRVELRDRMLSGTSYADAIFYVNTAGKEINPAKDMIGMEAVAVARTTALCPYIALINHGEDAANTLDVDYIKVWSNRQ